MSTFSKYWKVKVRVSSFGPPIMYLSPFEYEKPIFNIVCDKDEIDSSSSTTCEVKVNSNYILNKVSFNLDIDRFNISNEEANEAFDLEKDDTSEYILTLKNGVLLDIKDEIISSDSEDSSTSLKYNVSKNDKKEINNTNSLVQNPFTKNLINIFLVIITFITIGSLLVLKRWNNN